MFKALRRWWKYLGAKVNSVFNAKADPKIQLEQAITEAQDQHRRLKEQAANVIANQKQTEMRLDRAMEELEKVSGNAKQAVLMADEAAKKGDTEKVEEFTAAAESFATPPHRHREGGRGPQDAGPPVLPGQRPGQGGGPAERHRPAAEAGRAPEAPLAARPGEDAGAGQQGHGLALRDRRRGRPDLRRGAGQDRGPLRQGQGHVRAHRVVGGVPDARGRAGRRQQRGPDPPRPDPRPARARARHRRSGARHRADHGRRAGRRSRARPGDSA